MGLLDSFPHILMQKQDGSKEGEAGLHHDVAVRHHLHCAWGSFHGPPGELHVQEETICRRVSNLLPFGQNQKYAPPIPSQ